MVYRRRNRTLTGAWLHVWLGLLCVALCGVLVDGQSTAAVQQQRPRRAGSPPSSSDTIGVSSSAGEELDENDVVRVDTQLITVPVVVRDESGRPVTGLTASAFQLYEDARPQQVATFATSDAPFEVALL